jgi:hypothetical protein
MSPTRHAFAPAGAPNRSCSAVRIGLIIPRAAEEDGRHRQDRGWRHPAPE